MLKKSKTVLSLIARLLCYGIPAQRGSLAMLKRFFPLTVLVLLAMVTLFFLAARSSALHLPKFTESATNALPPTPNEPVKNIRFTVYDVALYPHELQVDAGRVAIAFDDRTGRNSGFVVQRLAGNTEKVGEINFPRDRSRTRGEVRLTAGRYRVFSRERPEMQSLLIVNP